VPLSSKTICLNPEKTTAEHRFGSAVVLITLGKNEKARQLAGFFNAQRSDHAAAYARFTFPERRHLEQTDT
jgi:Holliday junction resolvase-like predicted endonuclease